MKTNALFRSIVIVTHWFSPGTSQALYQYSLRKKIDALYIEHKLFGNPISWSFGVFDKIYKVLKTGKTNVGQNIFIIFL